jgi:hypothetical protein
MQNSNAASTAKTRVFADTNVILEAFRTHCWKAINSHFSIETVEKCVEETLTGNPSDSRHIAVPPADLHAGLAAQHSVTRNQLAALVPYAACATLDDGEKHLLAWLSASKLQPSTFIVITTADKAALVAVHALGWLDHTISLEELARKAGVGRTNLDALALQYREDWLSSIKTKIQLGIIP